MLTTTTHREFFAQIAVRANRSAHYYEAGTEGQRGQEAERVERPGSRSPWVENQAALAVVLRPWHSRLV
jgi:hypothetical protein